MCGWLRVLGSALRRKTPNPALRGATTARVHLGPVCWLSFFPIPVFFFLLLFLQLSQGGVLWLPCAELPVLSPPMPRGAPGSCTVPEGGKVPSPLPNLASSLSSFLRWLLEIPWKTILSNSN